MEAVSYVALLLTVPLIFVNRPISVVVMIILSNTIFDSMVIILENQPIRTYDLINSIVFGTVSIFVSSYMMKIKLFELKNEVLISKLANHDMMTGLLNRNCFERSIDNYATIDKKGCYCVYVDVNGLHELNNVSGHATGDKMLIFVGKTLKMLFENEDAYRIGGDEFLICGVHKTEDEVKDLINKFYKEIENAGYYASVGFVYELQGPFDMISMMKSAEEKMWYAKRRFYEQKDFDRRNRSF